MATDISSQIKTMSRFWTTLSLIQVLVVVLFGVYVRYDDDKIGRLDIHSAPDPSTDTSAYFPPMVTDIQMMLFVGFGFLMTFLPRFGNSAVCLTMIVVVVSVEISILVAGFLKRPDSNSYITITWSNVLEGGFSAAAVLISLGGILGKVNPLQVLAVTLIEVTVFELNAHLGYVYFEAADVGGSIFIHVLGAYFGLAVALTDRKRDFSHSVVAARQISNNLTDDFCLLGSLVLWVFWPSFNAILDPSPSGRHRASMNTYLSLSASTVTTFILSSVLGETKKMYVVDAQNASLSGGVAMGAIANMMMQPYGAVIIGSVAGLISTFGQRVLQGFLQNKLGLHDTCGIHNLHGMPALMSGILSALFAGIASYGTYGDGLFLVFPAMAPSNVTHIGRLQRKFPAMLQGKDRSSKDQAVVQLSVLGITFLVSLVCGSLTGLFIGIDPIFNVLKDEELFEDSYFFNIAANNTVDDFVQNDGKITTLESSPVLPRQDRSPSPVAKYEEPLGGSVVNPKPPQRDIRSSRSPNELINSPDQQKPQIDLTGHSFKPNQVDRTVLTTHHM